METFGDGGGVTENLMAEGARQARGEKLPFDPHNLHRSGKSAITTPTSPLDLCM